MKYFMAWFLDFSEEMTAFQLVTQEFGVDVLSKFHSEEIAGKRIEYLQLGSVQEHAPSNDLGFLKGKTSFKALVNECTSRDVLATTTVQKLFTTGMIIHSCIATTSS